MSDFTVAVGVVVFLSWALLRLSRCCAHRHITTPRRDEEGAYVRCLGCGGRIAAPQWDMEPHGARREAAPLTAVITQQSNKGENAESHGGLVSRLIFPSFFWRRQGGRSYNETRT